MAVITPVLVGKMGMKNMFPTTLDEAWTDSGLHTINPLTTALRLRQTRLVVSGMAWSAMLGSCAIAAAAYLDHVYHFFDVSTIAYAAIAGIIIATAACAAAVTSFARYPTAVRMKDLLEFCGALAKFYSWCRSNLMSPEDFLSERLDELRIRATLALEHAARRVLKAEQELRGLQASKQRGAAESVSALVDVGREWNRLREVHIVLSRLGVATEEMEVYLARAEKLLPEFVEPA